MGNSEKRFTMESPQYQVGSSPGSDSPELKKNLTFESDSNNNYQRKSTNYKSGMTWKNAVSRKRKKQNQFEIKGKSLLLFGK